TLDGFDDDGRSLVVDGRFHGGQIVVWDVRESVQERFVALARLLTARRVHRRESAPVERAVGGNDLVPVTAVATTVQPNQLERRLIRIRTAVREATATAEPVPGDRLGQQRLRLVVQEVADVPQLA